MHSRNTAWGWAWADYYCDTTSFTNFCIRCEPTVPVMSLHCTAQHSGTAVSSMSCLCWLWTSQNTSTVSHFTQTHWSVSHMRDGKLPGQHSSTVSVGSICLYHVSAHSLTCLRQQSSWQTTSRSGPCCSGVVTDDNRTHGPHQYTRMHRAFQGVHRFREPGCNKHRADDTDIHVHRQNYTWAIVMINVTPQLASWPGLHSDATSIAECKY